ncbi:MAG: ammonium transporter [Thermoplasmata archaeon]|nr:ammonium transporter [Thermoplasmata archaeon]
MKFAMKVVAGLIALVSIAVFALPVASAFDSSVNETSSVFMFFCGMLVFIMAPGIALFYGGMLRKQSMTSMMAQCLGVMGLVGVIWWVVGYSLAAGGDGLFIGNLDYIFGNGLSITEGNGNISTFQFFVFQGCFAIVTGCIVFGATAERIRFPAVVLFLALWSFLVYAPMAHMVWFGGFLSGFLEDIGFPAQDFAGGTVVHMCSAISGVAAAVAIGKRSSRIAKGRSHNVPFMFLGAMILWVGWFGFNCGSEGGFDEIAILAMVNTFLASVVSTVVWIVIQYFHVGRISVTGMCAGVIAGLVGITPGCGFVDPWAAVVIGAVAAVVVYFGIIFMREKSGIDDALDVMGVHGIGGIWGCIAVGIFSVSEYSWVGIGGLIEGEWTMLVGQLVNVVFTLVYCFVVSFVIMKVIDVVMKKATGKGAALTEEEQMIGSDIIEHGEPAYVM